MNTRQLIRRCIAIVRQYVLPRPLGRDESQKCIALFLSSPHPCMIGRFGSAEIQAVVNSIFTPPIFTNFKKENLESYRK